MSDPVARLPYPGLRAFEREEADLFFGRDGAVNDLIARLSQTRFLAVLGASGTGKSSLVRTGMLDGLELGLHPAGANWRFCDMAPGGHPIRNLARALLGVAADDGEAAPPEVEDVEALEWFLRRGPRSLIEWMEEGHLPGEVQLLVLVDQFEELFRFVDYEGREVAEAFVKLLIHASRAADSRIHIVVTMRSEYLGACVLIPGLAETINRGSYLTPRMDRESCRQAIEGPARMYGTDIEPGLVTQLLNDLDRFAPFEDDGAEDQLRQLYRRADQLPVMQHVLNRVWQQEARDGQAGPLRLETYRALGGISGALDRHGAEILAGLGADGKATAERVFRALVDGSTIAGAGRRALGFAALVRETGLEDAEARRVVEAFRSAEVNFLRPPAHLPLEPATIVDISHESLIRQWSRLSDWLLNEARGAAFIRRIAESRARHEAGEGDLLAGLELANIDGWWQQDRPTAEWARRYTDEFECIESYLRLCRETDAEVQARRAQRFRRERRRLYIFAGVTSAIALVAVGFFLWASEQQRVAVRSEADMLQATERLAIGLVEKLEKDQTIPLESKYGLIQDTEDAFRTIAANRAADPDFTWQRADFLLASVAALNRGGYWAEAGDYTPRLEELLAARPNGWAPDLDFALRSAVALSRYYLAHGRPDAAQVWLEVAQEQLGLSDAETPSHLRYLAQVMEAEADLASTALRFERALEIAGAAYERFATQKQRLEGAAGDRRRLRSPEAYADSQAALAELAAVVIKLQSYAGSSITQIDAHMRFGVDYDEVVRRTDDALDFLKSVKTTEPAVLDEAALTHYSIRAQQANETDRAAPKAVYEIDKAVALAEDLSAADPSNRHRRVKLLSMLITRGKYAQDAGQFGQAGADLNAALDLLADLRLRNMSVTDRTAYEPWVYYYRWTLASRRGGETGAQQRWERTRLAQRIDGLAQLQADNPAPLARLKILLAYVDLNMVNRDLTAFDAIEENVDAALAATATDNLVGPEPYFWLAQRQFIYYQLVGVGRDKLGAARWSDAYESSFSEADDLLDLAPGSYRATSNQMGYFWSAAAAHLNAEETVKAVEVYRHAVDLALTGLEQERLRVSEIDYFVDSAAKLIRNVVINGDETFDETDLARLEKLLSGELADPRSPAGVKAAEPQLTALRNELTDLAERLETTDRQVASRIPGVADQIGAVVAAFEDADVDLPGQTAETVDIDAVRAQLREVEIDPALLDQGLVYWVRPPLMQGVWHTLEGAAFEAMKANFAQADFANQITYIRSSELPFYDNGTLVEVQLGTGPRARLLAFIVLDNGDLHRLEGKSPPIHEVNAKAPIVLETPDQVAAYLRFFTHYVNGDEGSFSIVESASEIPFSEAAPREEYDRAQKVMRPFVVWRHPEKADHWMASATVYHGRSLFHAVFELQPTGMPEMQNDTPKVTELQASLIRVSDREDGVRLEGEAAGQSVDYGRLDLARHETDPARVETAIAGARVLPEAAAMQLRHDFAAPLLTEAFASLYGNAFVYRNSVAYELLIADTNLELALDLARMAAAESPDSPYIADTLGWALLKAGQVEEATVELERAIAGDPEQAEMRAHLAQAYRALGRKDDARAQVETGLALLPDPFWRALLESERALLEAE